MRGPAHPACITTATGARAARRRAVVTAWMALATAPLALDVHAELPRTAAAVVALADAGRFREAEDLVDHLLFQDGRQLADMASPVVQPEGIRLSKHMLSEQERRALAFERERMRRIRMDFTLDEAALRERVRRQIPDLRDDEFARWFAQWKSAGLFESMTIDGDVRYFNRAPSNLFRLSAEARSRRDPSLPPITDGPMESLNPHQRATRDAALAEGDSSVRPLRVRMTQTVTVEAGAVPAGETIRAWIPYPRAIPGQQEDIRFVRSEPSAHVLAPESALQRTVALAQPAVAGKPTGFAVTYELTVSGRYHAIDPRRVVPVRLTDALRPYMSERAPHVVFTDALRAYSREVVGDETNPYRIAQKLFAAVDRIPWAGAREYSTIRNLSDYALHAGHADCGQQTLLLIALLRLNGIPARWQSGMVFSDGDYHNIHDWGQLYLEPYGWVPMDVTTGRLAADKDTGDDPSMEWFYLGGLDNWRIAFNDDWSQPFAPAKTHFRSDTVDSQRGEVEWDGGNLYYDQWDYDFEWQLLPFDENTRTANAVDANVQHNR